MPSFKTILKAALIVGTLDILAACAQFYFKTGKTPFKPVLTFVASGLLGKEAFTQGDSMVLVGLVIHYCIATFNSPHNLLEAYNRIFRVLYNDLF